MRALILLLGAVGCAFEPRGLGAPEEDAGTDAAADDAAGADASPADAAIADAAVADARLFDAAPPIDARLIDAAPPIDAPPRCVGYQTVSNAPAASRYRRVNALTTWTAARDNCTTDGGYLVIPETPTEAIAVYNFVNPDSDSPFYWAGASDPQLDGTWVTVLNQAFTPPFAGGQPNQRDGEIYLLVASSGRFFDWFDTGTQEYACECQP